MKNLRRISESFRSFVAWMTLVLFVIGFTPIGASFTGALGALDRNHQLQFQSSAGRTRVVLHHYGSSVVHRHSFMANALSFFAQAPQPGQRDHVLQFAATDNIVRPTQLPAPIPTTADAPVLDVFVADSSPWSSFTSCSLIALLPRHAQPFCTRSTVLLI